MLFQFLKTASIFIWNRLETVNSAEENHIHVLQVSKSHFLIVILNIDPCLSVSPTRTAAEDTVKLSPESLSKNMLFECGDGWLSDLIIIPI